MFCYFSLWTMERVKRSLSELCKRQKRKRIAQNVQKELERSKHEEHLDSSTDEDVCAPPVGAEGEATESLIEAQAQQGSELTSGENDGASLNDSWDDLEWESEDLDEEEEPLQEGDAEQLPNEGREGEVPPSLASKLADTRIALDAIA